MSGWTLAGEIARRGLTEREARMQCGMDEATFHALVVGGQTLPQLALKVGRGLGLTAEQTRELGHPLNEDKWTAPGGGLPEPTDVDIDPMWYLRLDGKRRQRMASTPIYIDLGACALWAFAQGRDPGEILNEWGSPCQQINSRLQARIRLKKIREAETAYKLPPEVAETTEDLSNTVFVLRWLVDKEAVRSIKTAEELTPEIIAKRWVERMQVKIQKSHAITGTKSILDKLDRGDALTRSAADKIAVALGRELREIAMPVIIRTTKKAGRRATGKGGGQ